MKTIFMKAKPNFMKALRLLYNGYTSTYDGLLANTK